MGPAIKGRIHMPNLFAVSVFCPPQWGRPEIGRMTSTGFSATNIVVAPAMERPMIGRRTDGLLRTVFSADWQHRVDFRTPSKRHGAVMVPATRTGRPQDRLVLLNEIQAPQWSPVARPGALTLQSGSRSAGHSCNGADH